MKLKSGRHPEKQLTARRVATLSEPGKYMDGNGLFLRVTETGARQWVQRVVIRGHRRDIGHGAFPLVSLAEAREKAFTFRKAAREGQDPYADRRKDSGIPTFAEATAAVIELNRPTWSNSKHAAQWESTLKTYVFPRLGKRPVDSITSADVLAAVTPIWNEKPETAKRVRQRVAAVLDWAVGQGYRQDNPAGAALAKVLPRRTAKRENMKALAYDEVADAIATIRGSGAYKATVLAFEFLVLTAARSGEVRGATWSEIDLETATWTVPAARMKADREHRVPLSTRALEVLAEARELSDGSGLVFPNRTGKAFSDSTLSKLCRENGVNAVPHGFRSSFRDWASERTNAPHAAVEAALAHTIPNAVERAYHRTDLFDRRRTLMDKWAEFLSEKRAKIVRLTP